MSDSPDKKSPVIYPPGTPNDPALKLKMVEEWAAKLYVENMDKTKQLEQKEKIIINMNLEQSVMLTRIQELEALVDKHNILDRLTDKVLYGQALSFSDYSDPKEKAAAIYRMVEALYEERRVMIKKLGLKD